jgi:hypothetical protein
MPLYCRESNVKVYTDAIETITTCDKWFVEANEEISDQCEKVVKKLLDLLEEELDGS